MLVAGAYELIIWRHKGDSAACLDGHGGGRVKGQGWEGLDREHWVGLRAGGDECRGQGVDLVDGQRSVEWLGEGRLLEGGAEIGGVASFDGEDGGGGGEVVLAHDVGGRAGIGGNSDALEDGTSGHEQLDGGGAEVISALFDRSYAGSYEAR